MEERLNTIGNYMKKTFGAKTVKLSLDGNFTCPNRDGTKGCGGCIFCSADGSGEFAGTIPEQIELLRDKWPEARYIAYFQNHTNTYAPVSELREKFYAALEYGKDLPENERPDIMGIAIATRPDCITNECYELLDELNKKTFMWVELGLQSSNETTGNTINRCHDMACYDEAVRRLQSMGIRIVSHMIFGLPKEIKEDGTVIPETHEEMMETIRHACEDIGYNPLTGTNHIFGIKLHMLNVVRGSQMEKLCPDYVPFESIDQYTDLVMEAVRIIPEDITIHRLSADAPRSILIAPEWSFRKRTILNTITRKLSERDIYQGMDLK